MTNPNTDEDINEYIGQIREFEEDGVHVSLWESRPGRALNLEDEILGNFPVKYFPKRELNLGEKFRYFPAEGGVIKMLKQEDYPEIK